MDSSRSGKLDAFDLRILDRLQKDATLPLEELAEYVGISSSPCWRRIRRLEDAGFIDRRVALLNRKKLNVGVTVFIAVRTNQHTAEWLSSFKNAVQNIPEIVDFYRMSGTIDYLLKAYLPDIESYDALYQKLISCVQLSDVTSMFAMEEIKSTTEIPLNFYRS
ncbi:Lrp/AsnC family transcriptional regulator [Microvirga sp. VF16]|uniref:Lrp/AsnC family transcriptional regulator n=1 Tax=Microvirga sp. VF16 TaxID=2807101 RepID=UPI00193CA71C|nr:Lrp/AsnC family transcriptional regulator [Microvirga sp. VF16]QRM35156.1 Lrp/AsnC family transcriptional regulator [Microvirga sp. VF16]